MSADADTVRDALVSAYADWEEALAAHDRVQASLAAAEAQRDTLAEAFHRISEHVVVSEGEFPDDNCDWHCTAEIVSIARAALAAVAPAEAKP